MSSEIISVSDDGDIKPFRSLAEITEDEEPLLPIPPDPAPELIYNHRSESRCLLCKSHLRTHLEHLYVASGRSPKAVLDFLATHYHATYNYDSLTQHMRRHAELDQIVTSGLGVITGQKAALDNYRYKELELAIDVVMVQMDRVQGMVTRRDPDLELRQANTMMQLSRTLAALKTQRDQESNHNVDVFTILVQIKDSLSCNTCKKIMHQEISALRSRLMGKKAE